MYICDDCDYVGNKPLFDEENEEYVCPLCGSECTELEESFKNVKGCYDDL